MIISTEHLKDKLREYRAVFQNVSLTIYEDGSGSFDIGTRNVTNEFFMDSFSTLEECLSKNPNETKANAEKWGWVWTK